MSRTTKITLALMMLSIASSAAAQYPPALFSKVENAIRQEKPAWTMMDQLQWPPPRVQAAVYRWRLDQSEVIAWIIVEPSIERTIMGFHDKGSFPINVPAQKLDFGDESYFWQTARSTSIVLRKGKVLVRLGGNHASPQVLTHFAAIISSVIDELSTSKTKKDEANSRVDKGEAALKKGQYDEAIDQFKTALEIDPESANAYRGLGVAYFKSGDKQKASEAFKKPLVSIQTRPRRITIWVSPFTKRVNIRWQLALLKRPFA